MDDSVSGQPVSPEEYGRAVQLCLTCTNEVDGPQCMFCGSKQFKIRSAQALENKQKPKYICTGFLYKQGGERKNWRRRFFALSEEGQLSYHKTDQLHIKQLDEEVGSLEVKGATIQTFDLGVHEERCGYVMSVTPLKGGIITEGSIRELTKRKSKIKSPGTHALESAQRPYLLEAESLADRTRWIQAFQKLGCRLTEHTALEKGHSNSVIEGNLWKKGGWRRNWKKRWFCLFPHPGPEIIYTPTKDDVNVLGRIQVTESLTIQTENSKGYLFKIESKVTQWNGTRTRTFVLKAQDEHQRQQWIKAITEISKGKEVSSGGGGGSKKKVEEKGQFLDIPNPSGHKSQPVSGTSFSSAPEKAMFKIDEEEKGVYVV